MFKGSMCPHCRAYNRLLTFTCESCGKSLLADNSRRDSTGALVWNISVFSLVAVFLICITWTMGQSLPDQRRQIDVYAQSPGCGLPVSPGIRPACTDESRKISSKSDKGSLPGTQPLVEVGLETYPGEPPEYVWLTDRNAFDHIRIGDTVECRYWNGQLVSLAKGQTVSRTATYPAAGLAKAKVDIRQLLIGILMIVGVIIAMCRQLRNRLREHRRVA